MTADTAARRTVPAVAVALAAALALTLVGATGPVAADASETDSEAATVVALSSDGSARVTARVTFDLQTSSDRAAFDRLRANESVRRAMRDRFADRMRAVATSAESATGREMRVSDPRVELRTDERTGVVALSVRWEGLAAREDGRLVVTEPFRGATAWNGSLTVVPPDGYELADARPAPTDDGGNVTWSADATLDGFRASFAPAAGTDASGAPADATDANGPGFGGVAALLALLALVAGGRWR